MEWPAGLEFALKVRIASADQVAIILSRFDLLALVQRLQEGGSNRPPPPKAANQSDDRAVAPPVPDDLFEAPYGRLTPAELVFCVLRAHGLQEPEIAAARGVAITTVKTQRRAAWGNLGVKHAHEFHKKYGERYRKVTVDQALLLLKEDS